MKLHKTEIARHQIDTAIDLFLEDKDFISALTLAGVGEELTGKLIERAGEARDLVVATDHRVTHGTKA